MNQDEQILLSSLSLARVLPLHQESLTNAVPWFRACLENSIAALPLGLVADLGYLFSGSTLKLTSKKHLGSGYIYRIDHPAIQAYEDDFLRRLEIDPHYIRIVDAIRILDLRQKPKAIAFLIHSVLDRISYQGTALVQLAIARKFVQKPADEIINACNYAYLKDLDLIPPLLEDYLLIAKNARHCSKLLCDNDALTLENFLVLDSQKKRTQFKQVVDAAELLETFLPKKVHSIKSDEGVTVTRIQTDSSYPMGGFTTVTNSGTIENLLSSELIYMDDNDNFDLFDVRYTEGDLLYYSRDDNQFYRTMREYTFIVDSSFSQAQVKHPQLPFQDIVLFWGMLLCIVRRIADLINAYELKIRVLILQPQNTEPFSSDECENSKIYFSEWINSGILEISRVKTSSLDFKNLIFFSYEHTTGSPANYFLHCHYSNHQPTLCLFGNKQIELIDNGEALAQWIDAAENILARLH